MSHRTQIFMRGACGDCQADVAYFDDVSAICRLCFFSFLLVVLKYEMMSAKRLNFNSKFLNSAGMLDTRPGW